MYLAPHLSAQAQHSCDVQSSSHALHVSPGASTRTCEGQPVSRRWQSGKRSLRIRRPAPDLWLDKTAGRRQLRQKKSLAGRSLRRIFGGQEGLWAPILDLMPQGGCLLCDTLSKSQKTTPGPSHYPNPEHDVRSPKPLDTPVVLGNRFPFSVPL